MPKRRRIKSASIQRLSLCRRGKNGLTTLFKSLDDDQGEWQMIVKGDDKGELLAVAYPIGKTDSDGDFVETAEAIESMAHSFMRNGAELDIEHDGVKLTKDQAYIKESFVIQKGDERFKDWPGYDGEPFDATGGWGVILQLDDLSLRKSFSDGEWDGISLFGQAVVEQVDLKAASERVAARMGAQETDMTEAEKKALADAIKASVAEMVKSAVTEATKPADKPETIKTDAPVFDGDPSKVEDLEAFAKSLKTYEMSTKIAAGDLTADDITEMVKSLTEKAPTAEDLKEAGIEARDDDTPEMKRLQTELFKARKGRNAPEGKSKDDDETDLFKSSDDWIKESIEIANEISGVSEAKSKPSFALIDS